MSIDMMSAMDSDMAVIREDGTKDYVENSVIEDDIAAEQDLNEVPKEQEHKESTQETDEQETFFK